MMRHLLLFTCLLIFTRAAAQDYNKSPGFIKANSVWLFGNNAGYDFNTRIPIRQPMNSEEGCSSMADPNTGELLFYSDGKFCWNKNRVLMSGSYSPTLTGNNINNGTTSQGVCIVPFIEDKSKYYIFSLEPQGGYGSADGASPTVSRGRLYYSVLDMELNNGLGNIDTSRKNIFIDSSFGEMMIAIPGNNCDVWLMVHTTDSAVFKAYNISAAGVNLSPIISRTGAEMSGKMVRVTNIGATSYYYQYGAYAIGQMAISSDRSKLVISSGLSTTGGFYSQTGIANGVLLCNFNASTGILSDAILVDTIRSSGVAFSPDDSKLYTTWNDPSFGAGLNQFDISNFNATAIKNSKTLIKSMLTTDRGLRLYNDTIYMAFGGRTPSPYVHRINNPNLAGTACNVQDSALVLAAATSAVFSLPNDVVFANQPDISRNLTIDTTICAPIGMFPPMDISAPPGYTTFTWQDGSTTQNRNITDPGIYWVQSTDGCHSRVDTFKLQQDRKSVV